MADLAKLYREINKMGITAINNQQEQIDTYLSNTIADNRRGLTLLTGLPAHVVRNINFCLQELKATVPSLYYYPSADMHITIIDLIAASNTFTLSQKTAIAYQEYLQKIVTKIKPIKWEFAGFIVSSGAILAKGYYSPNLSELRAAIRNQLPVNGLKIDERYPTYSGHVTVARFKKSLSSYDKKVILQFCKQHSETELGKFTTNRLELVVHDWYNHYCKQLRSFHLE